MGWSGWKNGKLIEMAEASFDVFITSDQNIRYQQNLSSRKIAILILSTNDWNAMKHVGETIRQRALEMTAQGYSELDIG